jgi:hypothetical protein
MASTASPPSQRQQLADQGQQNHWSPQPQRIKHRRTFGDFARGFGAFLTLAALVLGVPYVLARFIGWPLPHHLPNSDTFSQPLSQTTVVHALAVIVWLAWAQFTACVLIEFRAAKRGVGMPRHLFGAGPSQFLARQLVAALLMVGATAASFVPNLAQLGGGQAPPARAAASVSAPASVRTSTALGSVGLAASTSRSGSSAGTVFDSAPGSAVALSATVQSISDTTAVPAGAGTIKLYRVVPPDGRNHDSLWDIAQRHLGDGRRYKEIFELNKDRVQPDGQKLTNASLIRPGWILAMPADATGGDLVLDESVLEPVTPSSGVTASAFSTPMPVGTQPAVLSQSAAAMVKAIASAAAGTGTAAHTATPHNGPVTAPVQPAPAQLTSAPFGSNPYSANPGDSGPNTIVAGGGALAPASHRGSHAPEESHAPAVDDRLLYGLAGAPLLSAGLLLALRRHRRRQLWHRIFGRRPVTAAGDPAAAEESIRIGAGEVEVWFLDLALRGLSAACIGRGQDLPAGYALKLRPQGLELMLSSAIDPTGPIQPPAPWYAAPDGRSWNFPRERIAEVEEEVARRCFAPYPGLVSIGSVSAGGAEDRLLIDLEEARGVIAVDGPVADRKAVLAALAAELATNSWSDRMSVTLIGFPGELTPLAPARIRHARTLDEVLPSLETEAAERERALRSAGLASVLDGRARASQASSFPPHFVIVAEEPHPAILARLVSSAVTTTRVGMGFVVAGTVTGASWQFQITSDNRIVAPELGIDADPQYLPEDQYAAILGLFRAVSEVRGAELAPAQIHQSVGYAGALPDEAPSIYVAMLGRLEVIGGGLLDPDRAGLLEEALVYLIHHRDGVHPRVLAAALWPRGATSDVAESTFARLGEWLGADRTGAPNLQRDQDGRLRLGQYVWSDWDQFQSLQSRALYDASVQHKPGQRDQLLSVALDLVRGPYLAERDDSRYAWLSYEIAEAQVPALIADTALQLADSCVSAGMPEASIDAVKAGMRGSPDDEELWRGLLRATAATGDMLRLEGAIEGLYKRTWYVHGVKGLHPRTEALVDELLPTWRTLIHS